MVVIVRIHHAMTAAATVGVGSKIEIGPGFQIDSRPGRDGIVTAPGRCPLMNDNFENRIVFQQLQEFAPGQIQIVIGRVGVAVGIRRGGIKETSSSSSSSVATSAIPTTTAAAGTRLGRIRLGQNVRRGHDHGGQDYQTAVFVSSSSFVVVVLSVFLLVVVVLVIITSTSITTTTTSSLLLLVTLFAATLEKIIKSRSFFGFSQRPPGIGIARREASGYSRVGRNAAVVASSSRGSGKSQQGRRRRSRRGAMQTSIIGTASYASAAAATRSRSRRSSAGTLLPQGALRGSPQSQRRVRILRGHSLLLLLLLLLCSLSYAILSSIV